MRFVLLVAKSRIMRRGRSGSEWSTAGAWVSAWRAWMFSQMDAR